MNLEARNLKPTHRYHDLFIIAAYMVAVLVFTAALAPVFYAAGKWLLRTSQDHGWDQIKSLSWFMVPLGKTEFHGYFDRAAMVVALVGLWPLAKLLHLKRNEITGTVPPSAGWKQLLISFALAAALLMMMSAVCLWLGACKLNRNPAWLALGTPLISGLVVACMEEFLFRGAVLGILRRTLSEHSGVFWTTVIFAIVHFLKPPDPSVSDVAEVTWSSGFFHVTQLFNGFGRWNDFLGEFLLLVGVGWVLARARLATGGLWACIGLHAGWVAGMKYFNQLTNTTKSLRDGAFAPWMVENHCKAIVSPVVGFVPLIAILITGILILLIARAWRSRDAEKAVASRGV